MQDKVFSGLASRVSFLGMSWWQSLEIAVCTSGIFLLLLGSGFVIFVGTLGDRERVDKVVHPWIPSSVIALLWAIYVSASADDDISGSLDWYFFGTAFCAIFFLLICRSNRTWPRGNRERALAAGLFLAMIAATLVATILG